MKLSIFIVIVSCLFMVTFGAECDMDYCEKHIREAFLECYEKSNDSKDIDWHRLCVTNDLLSEYSSKIRNCNKCTCDLLPILCFN